MSYPSSPSPYGSPVPYGSYGTAHTQVAIRPHESSTAHIVIAWIVAALTLGYMLPWAIAATRNKTNTLAIALVNALLGWTLVGWIVALVMSASSEPRPVVYLNTAVLPAPYPPASPTPYPPPGYGSTSTPALPPGPSPRQWAPPQQSYGYPPAPQHDADRATEPTAILPQHDDSPWSRPNDLR